jgi:FkbM family methyltransferase
MSSVQILMTTLQYFGYRAVAQALSRAGAHRALLKWQAWHAAHYGEAEIRLLRYLVDPQRTAIDIGAAEGIYSFFLQRLARRCVAFEPNPDSCSYLRQVLSGVEIIEAAASNVDGETTLRVPVVDGIPYRGWATVEPKNQLVELPPHQVQEIRVRTVRPDKMALGDVGFAKIDVEGHELDVLAGLRELLIRCRPNLLIEVSGTQRGGSLCEVCRVLASLGYAALALNEGATLRAISKEIDSPASANVIFVAGDDARRISLAGYEQ